MIGALDYLLEALEDKPTSYSCRFYYWHQAGAARVVCAQNAQNAPHNGTRSLFDGHPSGEKTLCTALVGRRLI